MRVTTYASLDSRRGGWSNEGLWIRRQQRHSCFIAENRTPTDPRAGVNREYSKFTSHLDKQSADRLNESGLSGAGRACNAYSKRRL